MGSFALTLRSRPDRPDGILLILDDRRDADEMAFELRGKGHEVEVRELGTPPVILPSRRDNGGSRFIAT